MRATSSAGMVSSSWSRQANTTKVAKAPIAPTATIHQMCQIKAKPMTVAKNAQTKPVGELRGISISRYSGFSSDPVCSAARFLNCQKASSPVTSGNTAKLKAGGGEAVAHSSERPSQGSPVSSRSCARADADNELGDLKRDAAHDQ